MATLNLRDKARDLRNNPTGQEKRLYYQFLRRFKYRIHRQFVIGYYIVDFYCHRARLAIEIDGSQHYQEEKLKQDDLRTKYLESRGVCVLRFTNWQVDHQFTEVCRQIEIVVDSRVAEMR